MNIVTPIKGNTYTVTGREVCLCGNVWYYLAEIPREYIGPTRCLDCSRVLCPISSWYYRHFVPISSDDLGVTQEEVNRLYQPGPRVPIKEKT